MVQQPTEVISSFVSREKGLPGMMDSFGGARVSFMSVDLFIGGMVWNGAHQKKIFPPNDLTMR